jgi:hypothetical protein
MLGATIALSATLPATYNAAGYTATAVVYTAIGKVESVGEHGGSSQVSTFTNLEDGVTEKSKGSLDYGNLPVTLGRLPSDSGQDLIDTAFASRNRYSLKLTYPLRIGEATPEVHYMDVLVTKRAWGGGDANAYDKLMADFSICRAPVLVAAT